MFKRNSFPDICLGKGICPFGGQGKSLDETLEETLVKSLKESLEKCFTVICEGVPENQISVGVPEIKILKQFLKKPKKRVFRSNPWRNFILVTFLEESL